MELRPLGRSKLLVAPLSLGGNVFGWTADEAKSFQILDAFVDAGLNLIDTADVYSRWAPGNQGGESETIIGRWLKRSSKRDRVLIATKVGLEMGPGEKGLSREYIRRAVDRSLARLQVDTIDLYQAHQDDEQTPLEETLGAFGELMQQGKVRAIGASNYTAPRLDQALQVSRKHGLPRYESLQPLYNLYDRKPFEEALRPLCEREQIGVISYYSLARGFLTGKYRTEADLAQSPRGAGIKQYLNDRGRRILKALDDVSARHQTKPARVALAWLMAQPTVAAPISSATSLEQLSDLIEATRVSLSAADIEQLNSASAD